MAADSRGCNLERAREFSAGAVYSVRQVAQVLGRSVQYVRAAIRRGEMRGRRDRAGYMVLGRDAMAFVSGSWDGFGRGD